MKPSASDIREVAALLDEEHDDVEALAKDVLTKAYALYEEKAEYGLLFVQDGFYVVARGFTTLNSAEKWAIKQGLAEGEAALAVVKVSDHI